MQLSVTDICGPIYKAGGKVEFSATKPLSGPTIVAPPRNQRQRQQRQEQVPAIQSGEIQEFHGGGQPALVASVTPAQQTSQAQNPLPTALFPQFAAPVVQHVNTAQYQAPPVNHVTTHVQHPHSSAQTAAPKRALVFQDFDEKEEPSKKKLKFASP